MTPRAACPACDGHVEVVRDAADFVFHKTFRLVRCVECGLVTVDPVPDDDEFAAYYADNFYGKPSSTSGAALRFFYGRREATVRRHQKNLRTILDVGCGDGGFLDHMAKAGVDVTGFEPSAAGAARARLRIGNGGRVYDKLEDVAGNFDVVTAWHVLEHVAEPRPFLAQLRALVAPGGFLVLAVPNFESFEARVSGDAWFHLDVPRHLHHFSPRSLRSLVERGGFDVADVSTFSIEYGPFGILQTALNLLPIERNALYQTAKHGRPLSSLSAATAAATVVGTVVGGAVAVAANAVAAAAGGGGSITLCARIR